MSSLDNSFRNLFSSGPSRGQRDIKQFKKALKQRKKQPLVIPDETELQRQARRRAAVRAQSGTGRRSTILDDIN